MRARILAAAAAAALLALAAPSVHRAAEAPIKYPAKVTTIQGRIFQMDDLAGDLEKGSFVMYDGETEGRVPWRDIDTLTFVHNLGHRPGSKGPHVTGTRRVEIKYVDGQTRLANIVIKRIWGYDGVANRTIDSDNIASIRFDTTRTAPALYKTCEHGHVWEQATYNFCPYDGLPLTATRLDGGK